MESEKRNYRWGYVCEKYGVYLGDTYFQACEKCAYPGLREGCKPTLMKVILEDK